MCFIVSGFGKKVSAKNINANLFMQIILPRLTKNSTKVEQYKTHYHTITNPKKYVCVGVLVSLKAQ